MMVAARLGLDVEGLEVDGLAACGFVVSPQGPRVAASRHVRVRASVNLAAVVVAADIGARLCARRVRTGGEEFHELRFEINEERSGHDAVLTATKTRPQGKCEEVTLHSLPTRRGSSTLSQRAPIPTPPGPAAPVVIATLNAQAAARNSVARYVSSGGLCGGAMVPASTAPT